MIPETSEMKCPDCGFNSIFISEENNRILECRNPKCRHDYRLFFIGTRKK